MRAYERVADPARAERDALMVAHLDMARRIALRVARRVPDNVRQDDLIAAAMVGLAEAAERFDAARGQPFVAFAEKRIRGAVLDELRRGDVMSRRARARARQVSDTIRALGARLGRHPEDEEVAAALGVPVDQYLAELETLTHVACVPIDELTAEVAGDDEGPETSAARRLLTARLVAQLQTLPERDATLLSLYYVEELSYAEIGKLFGVTESRVCQLHSRALARLRAGFQEGRDG